MGIGMGMEHGAWSMGIGMEHGAWSMKHRHEHEHEAWAWNMGHGAWAWSFVPIPVLVPVPVYLGRRVRGTQSRMLEGWMMVTVHACMHACFVSR